MHAQQGLTWPAPARVACSAGSLTLDLFWECAKNLFRLRVLLVPIALRCSAHIQDVVHSLLHRDARREAHIGTCCSSKGSFRCGCLIC